MGDISKLNVGGTLYDIKDAKARTDVSDLKEDFDKIDNAFGKVESLEVRTVSSKATITSSRYVVPDTGTETTNASYKTYDINLSDGEKLFIAYTNTAILGYAPIVFYDSNGNYISGYQPVIASTSEQVSYGSYSGIYYTIPSTAKSACIDISTSREDIMYLISIVPSYEYYGISPLNGKKVVNFGDSIFGNFRDTNTTTDKSISKMIAEATGATVYNCGFGGCRMGWHSDYWKDFSMFALADAISTGTWTAQDAAIAAQVSGMPAYFSETLALLKTIDFNEVDYITIAYGVNDYSGNAFIDSVSSLQEYQYYKGALEYSVRTILTAFPHIRIVVITPCWVWFPDADTGLYDYSSDDEESVNTRGLYLYDYVNACKTVCEKMHIPCIDTYYNLGFNQYSYTAYFNVKGVDGAVSSDGTHPKQAGRQLRADRIVGQLNALF